MVLLTHKEAMILFVIDPYKEHAVMDYHYMNTFNPFRVMGNMPA